MAVCLLPGTELSFVEEVAGVRLWPWSKLVNHKTAIFRQLNQKKSENASRCARIFGWPDRAAHLHGSGCAATVLQLPATAVGLKLRNGQPISKFKKHADSGT